MVQLPDVHPQTTRPTERPRRAKHPDAKNRGTRDNAVRLRHVEPARVPLRSLRYYCCLKKNQNAPRPSEHPPVRGGEMSKRLGGIKGCKYKTSSWHLNGFPMVVTLGQQYNIGEKPTVILYSYINRHAGTPDKQRRQKSTLSNNKDKSNTIIETRTTEDHGDENLHNPTTRPRYSPGSRRRAVGDLCCCLHIKNRSDLYPVYPSLFYSRQRNEFPWSQANPK